MKHKEAYFFREGMLSLSLSIIEIHRVDFSERTFEPLDHVDTAEAAQGNGSAADAGEPVQGVLICFDA